MELRQLRTFEAVLAHGSVTEAANDLGLAPSSVSQQVRALERSLGVALFDRGPRGMQPTAAGERMRTWARRLLDQVDLARHEVVATQAILRLGALESVAVTHVPAVLARLGARRPDLAVEVSTDGARTDLLDAVAAGRLDAALLLDTAGPLGELGFPLPGAAVDFVDLEPVPLVLVAAPGSALAARGPLSRDDLRGQRLLVNVPDCTFWLAGERFLGPGLERVRAGGVAVLKAWTAQGLGITLLPEFAVAGELATGALVRLPFEVPGLVLRLVWRPERETLPGLRDVLYAASA